MIIRRGQLKNLRKVRGLAVRISLSGLYGESLSRDSNGPNLRLLMSYTRATSLNAS